MSKQTIMICDICSQPVDLSEWATVVVILQQDLKAGRPNAKQEKRMDAHIACLKRMGLPLPSGEVKLEEVK